MTSSRQHLGRWGEDKAAAWYRAQGWEVLDRNWRGPGGELDLVLGRGGTVVFCEVKTRSSDAYGHPAEAVDRRKQQRIRRLAVQWLRQHPAPAAKLRFDVACVLKGRLEVLEGAF
ncbi:MAG: YraN family protein [bacterium]|nr:YraN family protein [bacterium]MXZ31461.1 YraN family protein [Acidimicrobiia bacterium]MDE0669151.1 YraN family protein [bacterium]MYB25255.1 YraN family protein [Acidimicrobiia bacterium]MYE67483.1 YraN family protein [Acidimicrobiia bacterium]